MANTARQFVAEERTRGDESQLTNDLAEIVKGVDVVHIHGAWLPVLWKAAKMAKRVGAKLIIRPAGSYDPVRLAYHGWKKRLVSVWEHAMLRRADVVQATCEAEAEWVRAYEPRAKVELTDLKRFFRFTSLVGENGQDARSTSESLHVLYLGRRHPLKGVEFLEQAVGELVEVGSRSRTVELRIVSDHFGDELEKDWAWCDVLCLPTLSENFGRVVAEALERGKKVVTTDGAPVWGEGELFDCSDCSDCSIGYDGRLIYLKGYREGTDEERVRMLTEALRRLKVESFRFQVEGFRVKVED